MVKISMTDFPGGKSKKVAVTWTFIKYIKTLTNQILRKGENFTSKEGTSIFQSLRFFSPFPLTFTYLTDDKKNHRQCSTY